MARIIRPDQQSNVAAVSFGGAPAGPSDVRPWMPGMAYPPPAPEPEPEPVVEAPPPPPPPPPEVIVPEEIVAALYEDVFQRGLEEGRAQGYAELEPYKARYVTALAQLEGVADALVERNRVSVLTLACKVAEQVLRTHLKLNPQDLITQMQAVIAELDPVDAVVVRASADDYAHIVNSHGALAQGVGAGFTLQVVQDEALEPGDFQVETRGLTADARIRQRLSALETAMLQATQEGDGQ